MLPTLRTLDALLDRLPVSPRFWRFCIVGSSGVVVNLSVLALVNAALPAAWDPWDHRLAMAGGIVVSIFTNFLLHDAWTWRDGHKAGTIRSWLGRLGKFYLVSCLAAMVQWGVAVALYEGALHRAPFGLYLSQAAAIMLALFINFAANHLWTFRNLQVKRTPAPQPPRQGRDRRPS